MMAIKKELTKGKLADGRAFESISGAAEGEIGFGQFAVRGTDKEYQFEAFDGDENAIIAGIAMFTNSGNIDELKFRDKDAMRILRKGVMWVPLSEESDNVEVGDRVAVYSDGYAIKADQVEATDDDDSGHAMVIENAEFASSGEAKDVVKVEINLPSKIVAEDLDSA